MVNLKLFPQTALLMLIDALRSTDDEYKLDLYVNTDGVGGMLFKLKDAPENQKEAELLFVENDLQSLMGKFMALLQQRAAEEASIKADEPEAIIGGITGIVDEAVVAAADSTGVPE